MILRSEVICNCRYPESICDDAQFALIRGISTSPPTAGIYGNDYFQKLNSKRGRFRDWYHAPYLYFPFWYEIFYNHLSPKWCGRRIFVRNLKFKKFKKYIPLPLGPLKSLRGQLWRNTCSCSNFKKKTPALLGLKYCLWYVDKVRLNYVYEGVSSS